MNNNRAASSARPSSSAAGHFEPALAQLDQEIFELISAQVFTPGELATESAVCRAFSDILQRRWDLCCLLTYLYAGGADGHTLRSSATRVREGLDVTKVQRVGDWLAGRAAVEGREQQSHLGDVGISLQPGESADESQRLLTEAGVRAGVAVPVRVRGVLVGAVVALATEPERLREALPGVRFIAAPILIALGNARRAVALKEQRQRIEHLVEELQRRSDELEEANRELRRVNRYRSLFLARMSHELRTPLTSMLGFAEIMLEHEALSPAQHRFCEKIQSSGLQLQASLNQLVDLSRLEAGRTELFLHEFSAREMLRESCAAVGRLAQKQGIELECVTAPECGTIVSDEGKLRQVMYNFLSHAIVRSPAGGRVSVLMAKDAARERYTVDISDDGEPLSNPAHIFDPVDIDAPSETGTNMNELGLVIAHRLVGALGGTVALEARRPRGLVVRLELPTRPPEK